MFASRPLPSLMCLAKKLFGLLQKRTGGRVRKLKKKGPA